MAMEQAALPYSGTLLVTHLAAYGMAVALDAAGIDAFVGHDPASQSFEPVVAFAAEREEARAAIRASAEQLEELVEHDVEPGKTGNDRRATIWARASIDGERMARVVRLRHELVEAADRDDHALGLDLLAALGAPAWWGPSTMKTTAGATALDGVLGNHTSDLVRGVLRRTRPAAAACGLDAAADNGALEADRTGWAPPGTTVDFVTQWLAALGLALLPVAHRRLERSSTPACWQSEADRRRRGITLPVLEQPVSVARLRALLGLRSLAMVTGPTDDDVDPRVLAAHAELRSYGVREVVVFERRDRSSGGGGVAFDFRRGELVPLR